MITCLLLIIFNVEENPNFNDFKNGISSVPDDMIFGTNVMDGIELGCDRRQSNDKN